MTHVKLGVIRSLVSDEAHFGHDGAIRPTRTLESSPTEEKQDVIANEW